MKEGASRSIKEQLIAVKKLIKTIVSRAIPRNDMDSVRDALEIAFQVHRKDISGVADNIQRHLEALPVWDEFRFWEGYFDDVLERTEQQTGSSFRNYASLVTDQLIVLSQHMVGLGLPDPGAWFILEALAQKNNLGSKQLIKLRGILAHMELLKEQYWGASPTGAERASTASSAQAPTLDRRDRISQPSEAAGIGRSWVHSMFSRDRAQLAGRATGNSVIG